MITYKDNLKLKLDKLQKAIDEVSDINGSLIIQVMILKESELQETQNVVK